jgi:hypothetical protein
LKAQNLPQAETVAKASELLQEVVEKISEVLEDKGTLTRNLQAEIDL